ncbi:MAG: hypothetical protein P4L69_11990 [Desulfosporosinus sp.]|nr:hypothetical protein [Desulfosporosinus sp.]
MKLLTLQKFGGISLISGSALLSAYSIFFFLLLPVGEMRHDLTIAVLNSNWIWLAMVAFLGVILMLFGFAAVYSRLYAESGAVGFVGYLFIQIAYILQACKITWEIFVYPVIVENQSSVFLLKDAVLKQNSMVVAFGILASAAIFVGIILFCITLVRSEEFPSIAGILIFVGASLYGLGPMRSVFIGISGILILSIGCLLLGVRLNRNVSTVDQLW